MSADHVRTNLTTGLPAYFYPWPGSDHWRDLARLPPDSIVVLDPADGPGSARDPRYTEAADQLRAHGVAQLFGYVDSNYALRPAVDVVADAHRFHDWYSVEGVFVDRVLPIADRLDYYSTVSAGIRRLGLHVAFNPGQPRIEPGYWTLADHVVEFEGTRGAYLAMDAGSGEHGGSLATSWHLVYDVRTETDMREVVALARDRGAGLLFVTDGVMPNPWDRLPAYWHQQVSLIGGID